jgi:hypothetical protein
MTALGTHLTAHTGGAAGVRPWLGSAPGGPPPCSWGRPSSQIRQPHPMRTAVPVSQHGTRIVPVVQVRPACCQIYRAQLLTCNVV